VTKIGVQSDCHLPKSSPNDSSCDPHVTVRSDVLRSCFKHSLVSFVYLGSSNPTRINRRQCSLPVQSLQYQAEEIDSGPYVFFARHDLRWRHVFRFQNPVPPSQKWLIILSPHVSLDCLTFDKPASSTSVSVVNAVKGYCLLLLFKEWIGLEIMRDLFSRW
jgi:hypothetical protein